MKQKETQFVERELSKLMEATLQMEDELGSIVDRARKYQ